MKKILLSLTLVSIIGLISACGPRSLETGAENVHIKPSTAYIPKTCKFLGEISGVDVHGDMSLASSSQEMTLDDMNFLKNGGEKIGANVVVFKQHQLVDIQRSSGGKQPHVLTFTTHNIIGSAYQCPSDAMTTLKQWKRRYPTDKICKCIVTI